MPHAVSAGSVFFSDEPAILLARFVPLLSCVFASKLPAAAAAEMKRMLKKAKRVAAKAKASLLYT